MSAGVGGILGCLCSGVLTQYFHPKYSFLGYSFMGLIIALNGFYLTPESEMDSNELREHNLSQEES